MASVIIMPRQGNTVESCVIVRWKASEGDQVAAGQALCEVETDKATFDVPAGEAGYLLKILRPEGDDVPVLEPIAVVGARGEDWSAALGAGSQGGPGAAAASTPASPAAKAAAAPAPASATPGGATAAASTAATPPPPAPAQAGAMGDIVRASPRAKRLAAAEGVELASLAGTGPEGRVIERDVRAALEARPALTAAAKAAVAGGVRAPASGSALGGRAGLSDLGAAGPGGLGAAASMAAPGAGSSASSASAADAYADSAVKSVRKIIAERMRASLRDHAQLTLHASASAIRLKDLRARFKASDPELGLAGVTIGDLVLFAVSRVLPRHRDLNAHFLGDRIRSFDRVHLGLAVDTPRGLMVPVLRNADLLSLRDISVEAKRLAEACLSGKAKPEELSGSTFTVTNLGAFGVESFTPVLNAPEAAILGLCSIVDRPVARPDGGVGLEPRIGLSLTIDHQAVDGAPGARFLEDLARAIGDLDLLFVK